MNELEIETEVFQLASYSEIIYFILQEHQKLSVNKTIFFSYLFKQRKFMIKEVYTGKNKRDVIYKCISLLSGEFIEYCNSIEFIVKSVHLLILSGEIILDNEFLIFNNENKKKSNIYEMNLFFNKAIVESKKMTEKQFMREVVRCV